MFRVQFAGAKLPKSKKRIGPQGIEIEFVEHPGEVRASDPTCVVRVTVNQYRLTDDKGGRRLGEEKDRSIRLSYKNIVERQGKAHILAYDKKYREFGVEDWIRQSHGNLPSEEFKRLHAAKIKSVEIAAMSIEGEYEANVTANVLAHELWHAISGAEDRPKGSGPDGEAKFIDDPEAKGERGVTHLMTFSPKAEREILRAIEH